MNFAKYLEPTQREKATNSQIANAAGGFTFELDKWGRLDRFLFLGTEGGTFYTGERALTRANAKNVQACLDENGVRAVQRVVEISETGRAAKNDPALFVLAMAASHSSASTRAVALGALPQVARTGTHLFHFVREVDQMRGWGRGLRRAIANWYTSKPVGKLAYQLVKYQQRDGWSHRDLLRLSHPKSTDLNDLFRYATAGGEAPVSLQGCGLLGAFEKAKTATEREVIGLIREHGLTREMIPTEHLRSRDVWSALLEKMPLTAMIRNLGKMTQAGLLTQGSADARLVADRLADKGYLTKSRVHPFPVLLALKTYAQGRGEKGSLTWTPVQSVVDALDAAFYLTFENVEPTGKSYLLALDISGSMTQSCMGSPQINCAVAETALAMVTAASEKNCEIVGFTATGSGYGGLWGGGPSGLTHLAMSPRRRLDDNCSEMAKHRMGGTDCSLPMTWAAKHKKEIDTFVVYTDNETWAGSIQPHRALQKYRQEMGRPAKLIVVAFTGSGNTIADPSDAGMLDLVGFDSSGPSVMAEFSRGFGVGKKVDDGNVE